MNKEIKSIKSLIKFIKEENKELTKEDLYDYTIYECLNNNTYEVIKEYANNRVNIPYRDIVKLTDYDGYYSHVSMNDLEYIVLCDYLEEYIYSDNKPTFTQHVKKLKQNKF